VSFERSQASHKRESEVSKTGYVAFDLGAESGRAMLAVLDNNKLTLQECHRFANVPRLLPSGLHWNLLDLWGNLLEGLKNAGTLAREQGVDLVSLGVDTWGVDYGLISKSGELLGLPYAYRDERNPPAMQKAHDKLGADAIYRASGIQHMPFNSIYQLLAQHEADPGLLAHADHLLMMPDLLHYFFSGRMVNEATNASTTQAIDPHTGAWNLHLLEDLDLPHGFLGTTTPAGTQIGHLREEIAKLAGVDSSIAVIVPCTHDTASAIAAVPVDVDQTKNWLYLSSGTWSLMGAELDKPIVNDQSLAANFTNERGYADSIRFLKNISGLWLVQECRRDLQQQGSEYDYTQLTQMASEAEPFRTLVNTDHAPFLAPGGMQAKIADYAKQTGQPAPETPGQFVRCCLESLALTYRQVMVGMEAILGWKAEVLHIVGGGGQNQLLNQMTADATGIPAVVGPYEATAIGNALVQAIGHGQLADLKQLREVVRVSFEPVTYAPKNAGQFAEQVERFEKLPV